MAGDGHRPRGPYDRPRIVIAGALTALLSVLLLMDALSSEYQLGEVTLSALLGAILLLLGLEARDVIRGDKDR